MMLLLQHSEGERENIKNEGEQREKRAKFMITSARDPIICNGSVAHSR